MHGREFTGSFRVCESPCDCIQLVTPNWEMCILASCADQTVKTHAGCT
jgi:hypothetical protein